MAVTNVPAATLAQKWVTGMQGAGTKVTAGVEAVTVAPGQAAARAATTWLANTTASKARYQKNVAAVPLATWQSAMVTKGIPRMGTGATAAKAKFAATLTKIITKERSLVASLPARGSTTANIQRAVSFMQGMHAAKGTFTS